MTIEKFEIWKNGKVSEASELNLMIVSDDLISQATFYYRISNSDSETLAEGNINISGEDYEAWGEASNVNAEAYVYVAGKLDLKLIN